MFAGFLLHVWEWNTLYSAGSYMFKVNNRNTRTRYEICSKLTIKTPERHHWIYFRTCSNVSIIIFDQVNAVCLSSDLVKKGNRFRQKIWTMLKNYGITKLMSWICSILTVKTLESSFGDLRMYLLLLWTHLFHHSNTCVVEFYELFLCWVWLSYFSKDLLKIRSFAVIL